MSKKLNTEEQVMEALDIPDWRHLSKKKIMEFTSILPDIDKEVANNIIAQFPEFNKTTNSIINNLKETCEKIIDKNKETQDQAVEAYMLILDSLNERLNKKFLSKKEREFIINQMIYVAGQIDKKDTEHKHFLGNAFTGLAKASARVLIAGIAFVGGKIGEKFLTK